MKSKGSAEQRMQQYQNRKKYHYQLHMSQGVNFRIYKEMQKLNTKNLNHLIYKCHDELSILLLKVQIQKVKKYFKTIQYPSHQWTQLNYQEMKLAQMSTNRWED